MALPGSAVLELPEVGAADSEFAGVAVPFWALVQPASRKTPATTGNAARARSFIIPYGLDFRLSRAVFSASVY